MCGQRGRAGVERPVASGDRARQADTPWHVRPCAGLLALVLGLRRPSSGSYACCLHSACQAPCNQHQFHMPLSIHGADARPVPARAVHVSTLTSFDTELPYEYYSMPFCKPKEGVHRIANTANPGTILEGIRIENSVYNFTMKVGLRDGGDGATREETRWGSGDVSGLELRCWEPDMRQRRCPSALRRPGCYQSLVACGPNAGPPLLPALCTCTYRLSRRACWPARAAHTAS